MSPMALRLIPISFVLLWSTGFVVAKFGAPVAGPFSLLAARMGLVIVVLGLYALVAGRGWPHRKMALHAMFVGMLLHGVYLGGVFWAVKHGLPSGFSGLIVGLQPMITAIVARPVLGEKLTLRHGLGLGLGLLGVATVLAPRFAGGIGEISLVTVVVNFLAVVAAAYATVHQKRHVINADLVTSTLLQYVGAAVLLIPLAALEGFQYVPGWQLAGVLAWLVLVLSIGAVLLLLTMINAGQVSRVAALLYLVPPTTAVMAYLLFGENLSLIQMFGIAIVVFAVALVTRAK